MLCAIEVPDDKIKRLYGVFDVEELPDANNPRAARPKGMVEKPSRRMRRQSGRRRAVHPRPQDLRRTAPHHAQEPVGELQLTDAIALLISKAGRCMWWCTTAPVMTWAVRADYLKAAVDFRPRPDDYGPAAVADQTALRALHSRARQHPVGASVPQGGCFPREGPITLHRRLREAR